jgi:phage tail tube protein FII
MDTAITLTILYILIEVDGKTVVELDKLNEVYKVNGVDVLAKIKEMC